MNQPRKELAWQEVVGNETEQSGVQLIAGGFAHYTEISVTGK